MELSRAGAACCLNCAPPREPPLAADEAPGWTWHSEDPDNETAMTDSRSARAAALLLLLACTLAGNTAWAQQALPSSTAASAAERAQKETDRTMYWIRVLAVKPGPAPVAARPPLPPRAVATAPAPAARAIAEAREKLRGTAAPAPIAGAPADVAQVPAPALPLPAVAATPDTAAPLAADAAAAVAPAPEIAPEVDAEPDPGLVQVKSVEPDFPADIVRRVHKGNVEVRFEVDPDGSVVDAAVVDSSHSHLNRAALLAVKQWRFKPTTKTHVALVNLVFDTDAGH